MYIGIGPEKGKRIAERHAFSYACECCQYGDDSEKEEFWRIAEHCRDFPEFRERLEEWFYSEGWLYDSGDTGKTGWIIRFLDGGLRSFHGTYAEAVRHAREEARRRRTGFSVS